MIKIDGSYLEGGGQILRTALSLSAALQIPFEIINIRKNRKRPGLLPQHLTAVNAVAKICNAEVTGNKFASTHLIFKPYPIRAGEYEFNIAQERGSAGAVTLVAQALLPILINTNSRITIKGGTHVPFSPPYDFLEEILLNYLRRFGLIINSKIIAYGFFPVGRGKITIEFKPSPTYRSIGVILNRGSLKKINIISRVANLPITIAERQSSHLIKLLSTDFPQLKAEEFNEKITAACPGTYLFLKVQFENITVGFSALGEKGKPAEQVASEAYQEFKEYLLESECVYDSHLADQLGVFLALSHFRNQNQAEPFTIKTNKMTSHLQTNIWLIRQFIPGYQPLVTTPTH